MSFIDKIKNTVGGNADKATAAIEKAAALADRRTGGKHRAKIDKAVHSAKGAVVKLERDAKDQHKGGGGLDDGDPRPTAGG